MKTAHAITASNIGTSRAARRRCVSGPVCVQWCCPRSPTSPKIRRRYRACRKSIWKSGSVTSPVRMDSPHVEALQRACAVWETGAAPRLVGLFGRRW
jgi:hypothetical protein